MDKTADIKPTADQIARGLSKDREREPEIRQAWVSRKDIKPTDDQIIAGMNDPRVNIRLAWVERHDLVFPAEAFEMGLRASHPGVRAAVAKRPDFVPTLDQIERGLTDKVVYVRLLWRRLVGLTPTDKPVKLDPCRTPMANEETAAWFLARANVNEILSLQWERQRALDDALSGASRQVYP